MKKLITIAILLLSITANAQTTCKGITKKGEPCKSTFLVKGTGYCRSHNPMAIHCAHMNGNKQCGNVVTKQGDLCRSHKQSSK